MRGRRRLTVEGMVQGVGFRPFVFRLAGELELTGWVTNTSAGVEIEVEGEMEALQAFSRRLGGEAPPLARIASLRSQSLSPAGYRDFTIRASIARADRAVQVSPDVAVCPDCRRELLDPSDRRFRYPFINCVNCGPRYTIIRSLPYDRPGTSMAPFQMCPECRAEYGDPSDRRFHAQPDACAVCGPRLTLLDGEGVPASEGEAALAGALRLLREGKVVAVKGVGGFHLAADPCNPEAVALLRRRKRREEKPFALMVRDLAVAACLAEVDEEGSRLLGSIEAPIVLLPRRERPGLPLSPEVARRSRHFGLMLPSAPLHVLMMEAFPLLIMTSANLSDEPLCAGNAEAVDRLHGVADAFLVHDREIVLRCDDSIVRPAREERQRGPVVLRRARGFVPAPVALPGGEGPPVLALGAEMKGSVCVTRGGAAFIGQHLGDLQGEQAGEFLLEVTRHLLEILGVAPAAVACDLHPGYLTTRLATDPAFPVPWDRSLPVFFVQHHHAHILSGQAEAGRTGPVLGLALDGTGYGPDGTVWGGELLAVDGCASRRLGRLRPLWMPGGERAVREPYRMALSALTAAAGEGRARALGERLFPSLHQSTREALTAMAAGRVHGIATSSAGRLFDAFSAALGVCEVTRYEGQPAIELEMLTEPGGAGILPYSLERGPAGLWEADFSPGLLEAVERRLAGEPVARLGGMFHRGLARALAEMAGAATAADPSFPREVVLSGGSLQNEILSSLLSRELRERGFAVHLHRLVPTNDGGVSLGQAVFARCALTGGQP